MSSRPVVYFGDYESARQIHGDYYRMELYKFEHFSGADGSELYTKRIMLSDTSWLIFQKGPEWIKCEIHSYPEGIEVSPEEKEEEPPKKEEEIPLSNPQVFNIYAPPILYRLTMDGLFRLGGTYARECDHIVIHDVPEYPSETSLSSRPLTTWCKPSHFETRLTHSENWWNPVCTGALWILDQYFGGLHTETWEFGWYYYTEDPGVAIAGYLPVPDIEWALKSTYTHVETINYFVETCATFMIIYNYHIGGSDTSTITRTAGTTFLPESNSGVYWAEHDYGYEVIVGESYPADGTPVDFWACWRGSDSRAVVASELNPDAIDYREEPSAATTLISATLYTVDSNHVSYTSALVGPLNATQLVHTPVHNITGPTKHLKSCSFGDIDSNFLVYRPAFVKMDWPVLSVNQNGKYAYVTSEVETFAPHPLYQLWNDGEILSDEDIPETITLAECPIEGVITYSGILYNYTIEKHTDYEEGRSAPTKGNLLYIHWTNRWEIDPAGYAHIAAEDLKYGRGSLWGDEYYWERIAYCSYLNGQLNGWTEKVFPVPDAPEPPTPLGGSPSEAEVATYEEDYAQYLIDYAEWEDEYVWLVSMGSGNQEQRYTINGVGKKSLFMALTIAPVDPEQNIFPRFLLEELEEVT